MHSWTRALFIPARPCDIVAGEAAPSKEPREAPFARVLTLGHHASLAPLVALLLPESRAVPRADCVAVAQAWRPTLAFAPVDDADGLRDALALLAVRPETPLVVAAASPELARASVRAGAFAALPIAPTSDQMRAVLREVAREHEAVWALA